MYSVLIAVALVAVVSANIPADIKSTFKAGNTERKHQHPCCMPSYFTSDTYDLFTYASEGFLEEASLASESAYDAIAKMTAAKFSMYFPNGTKEDYVAIQDFKSGVEYVVVENEHGEKCYKKDLTENFPYLCIPEHAYYVGSSTLGDRALEIDAWYFKGEEDGVDVERLVTLQKDECIVVNIAGKAYDPESGKTVATFSKSYNNFRLGICDESEIFKVPDICEDEPLDQSEMSVVMQKNVRNARLTL